MANKTHFRSERDADLHVLSGWCKDQHAAEHLADTLAAMSQCFRVLSASLVQAERLTIEAENWVRQGEAFVDGLLKVVEAESAKNKAAIDELVRMIGLDKI